MFSPSLRNMSRTLLWRVTASHKRQQRFAHLLKHMRSAIAASCVHTTTVVNFHLRHALHRDWQDNASTEPLLVRPRTL
eukprot:4291980-Amphidinium_carterae.1